ncbi:hypothetical protein BDP27DRAFT_1460903 [Rhodocollybia butyracea]|uniref:Uncharacterized protein n=1 Tax=Rhodocollybia butyracea TaxID=206335 RepID=A0A9P5Q5N2_9AGAR|nr:hypothetical protein BDP27DRAFT_1460903 [Rhodocollybia butyracea]
MRLNPIFAIFAFTCTTYAVPLPDSSVVSIAQRTPPATPLQLNIAITFEYGDMHNGVKSLMKSAFYCAIDKHELLKVDPYDKITTPYTLKYVWRNVPHPGAPLNRSQRFGWFFTFKLPRSTHVDGDHRGEGSISRSGEDLSQGWGLIIRGVHGPPGSGQVFDNGYTAKKPAKWKDMGN